MPKNPFKDRPESSRNREMLTIGQRVLIVEKHMQGVTDKSLLTDGLIIAFLTSKPFHPQGIKVRILRKEIKENEDKYAVGRVQFLVEDDNDIQTGDIVQVTKSKNLLRESDLIEGVVLEVKSKEGFEEKTKIMVELCDGTIGWVQKVVSKM